MNRRSLFALAYAPFWRVQEPPSWQGEMTKLRNRLFAIEERLGQLEHSAEAPSYPLDRTLRAKESHV